MVRLGHLFFFFWLRLFKCFRLHLEFLFMLALPSPEDLLPLL